MNPAVGADGQVRRDTRFAVQILLFLLTMATTCAMGARLADNFESNRALSGADLLAPLQLFADPASLLRGVPFAATLLLILFAHEMGHYLACVYYRIDATLPYFLPSPLLVGTFGAFIRIRSAIYSKRVLFDVGVAGPVAGFTFVLPLFAIGMAYSKIVPGIGSAGDVNFSSPVLERLLAAAIFPGVDTGDLLLHPVARAAWVGAFATALNLLPIGQLDGGHILYAFAGQHHRALSRLFTAALIPLGFFYSWSWLVWAALLLFFMRHPRIYDGAPPGAGRAQLGLLAFAMLVLCFMPAPIRT